MVKDPATQVVSSFTLNNCNIKTTDTETSVSGPGICVNITLIRISRLNAFEAQANLSWQSQSPISAASPRRTKPVSTKTADSSDRVRHFAPPSDSNVHRMHWNKPQINH